MSVAIADRTELKIPAPELRGVAYELGACRDPEVCLEGKAGTGKTVGICFKVHMQHLMYPGLRGLMARKYMTDLTASAVQTYRALLRPEERVQPFGGSRFHPPGFRYTNSSIVGSLTGLTGVRRSRFFAGLWVAAEGTVYEDAYDRALNVVKPFPIPKEWPRYLSIDFGFTNPFVCGWWARDDDGRLFCYREIYMTKRLVEDHAEAIKHYSRWGQDGGDPLPREIICDTDAEDRATLERHLGFMTDRKSVV